MFEGREIIAVIPAGREATLALLVPHLLAAREWIDRCDLWVNTRNESDLAYLESLEARWPGFFRRIPSRVPVDGIRSVACFYGPDYRQPGTICLKLDDDLVWLAPDAIRRLLEFRVQNPDYFLVMADIWNNQLCDHLHQRAGLLRDEPCIEYQCTGSSWRSGPRAETVHRSLLERLDAGISPDRLATFERWQLRWEERFSINLVCWFGEDLAALSPDGLDGPLGGGDDEQYLSCDAPRMLDKLNVICGSATAAHYAFHPQKAHLDGTDVLERWRQHCPPLPDPVVPK
jgi:hypothetical protein